MHVAIAGYFPPPITGQTLATERLAGLLEDAFDISRIPLNAGAAEHVETTPGWAPGKISRYLRAGQHLKASVRQHPPDVLLWPAISPQTMGHLRDLMAVVPSLNAMQRCYGVVHWGNFETVFSRRTTRVTAGWLTHRLTGLVFLNDILANRCAPWVPDSHRVVIPNTIDTNLCFSEEDITAKHVERCTSHRPLRLLFLSNMIPEKGYQVVVEAANLLLRTGTPIELHLAGRWINPADERQFTRQISRELAQWVKHLGPVTDRLTIRELYRMADVFVFPTWYPTEAQPLVILEAMSAGVPIITTAHAGIPAMVEAGREALIVPPRDPVAIAAAVSSLIDRERWRTLAENARSRFLRTFSPEVVRQRWVDLITTTSSP